MPQNPYIVDARPATDAFAITPSDSVNFTQGMVRGIFVGAAGNVVVVTPQGNAVTFAAGAGSVLPVCALRVNSTNTTATGLVGLL